MTPRFESRLCLIVPGLLGPEAPGGADPVEALGELVSGLDLRAAETLLSRARATRSGVSGESPEELLFTAFGYLPPEEGDWPAAAVSRLADVGGEGGGDHFYLRADPVHLKPDMGDLVLFGGDHFELTQEEANALAGTVAAHFEGDGWRLQAPHPLRWYLRLDQRPRIRTWPLSMARMKTVDAHLPAGEDAARWHRLLNETQMLLHGCEINRQREARGAAPVNSLWFWGGGALPEAPATEWDRACGDSALLEGLAARAGIQCRCLPEAPGPWLESEGAGACLAFIDAGHGPARARDLEAWREYIEWLNRTWFEPVLAHLDGGGLEAVHVLTGAGVRYDAGRGRWWQRWKGRRSFARCATF